MSTTARKTAKPIINIWKPCLASWPIYHLEGFLVHRGDVGCILQGGHEGPHGGTAPDGRPFLFPNV
jgi:hypothetical protein